MKGDSADSVLTLAILALCFFNIGWIWQDPVAKRDREARRLYGEDKFDEALSEWRDAQIESPEKKELYYNIGNALHGQKKYEDAFNEYEKALDSKDAELQSKTYYNIGNTHYRMGKLPEAIEDYEKCLDINPDDEDAKYNIEFIRKKIKENLEKQEGKQGEQKKEESQQSQDKAQNAQAKEQKGQEGQGKEESEEQKSQEAEEERKEAVGKEGEKEEGGEERQRQRPQEQAEEGDMSKEDALRLLDAVKDDEKDVQRELRTQPGEGRYRADRDW